MKRRKKTHTLAGAHPLVRRKHKPGHEM
jgi:hypothetical protein